MEEDEIIIKFKIGEIHYFENSPVVITQIDKKRKRIEISRDILNKWNPFFVDLDRIILNNEIKQKNNDETKINE